MLLFKAQTGFSSDSNYCIIFLILMKLLAFPTPFPLLQIIFIPLPSWGFLTINGRRKVGYVFTVFLYPLSSSFMWADMYYFTPVEGRIKILLHCISVPTLGVCTI